jgi:hypothetical protein
MSDKQDKQDKNFSFIKLREEIITKSGGINLAHGSGFKEPSKKLKFEPNINITRTHAHENPEHFTTSRLDNTNNINNNITQDGIVPSETNQQSNTVNLSESNF